MEEPVSVQWFPGHMAKTRRLMKESLALVDAVVEIIDARIPMSSRNPEIDQIVGAKPRVVLMNKADLADAEQNKKWIARFEGGGVAALPVDCRSGAGLNRVLPAVRAQLGERIEAWRQKGMVGRSIKMMAVGIPNSGKSSFINRMAKGAPAKVEDRPGVTRGNQWFSMGKGYELLDTPGVLWPKFTDPLVGERLAFTGAVRDETLDIEQLAARLCWLLWNEYRPLFAARYRIGEDAAFAGGFELLEQVARRRGMLVSGGEADIDRAAATVLEEFRSGRIGRITLERCGEIPASV